MEVGAAPCSYREYDDEYDVILTIYKKLLFKMMYLWFDRGERSAGEASGRAKAAVW